MIDPFEATVDDFRRRFIEREHALESAAARLRVSIDAMLVDSRVQFHAVVTRVKSVDSVVRKLRKKRYPNPDAAMMDLIGVRVFTYFRSDSHRVAEVLRDNFGVDEGNSEDKACLLGNDKFGYTSLHLICRASDQTDDLALRSELGDTCFEVQIRTVLEHAWAEIEHELVYKAGTQAPDHIQRRFAASAAALEMVEHEFQTLRSFELELIAQRLTALNQPEATLDRAWLMACLASRFPQRESWHIDPSEDVFYPGREIHVLEHLRDNGVRTVGELLALLDDPRLAGCLRHYALERGQFETDLSHLVVALFACGLSGAAPLPSALDEIFDTCARQVLAEAMSRGESC